MSDVKAFGKTEGLFSNYLNFQVIADRVKDYQKLGDGLALVPTILFWVGTRQCRLLTIAFLQDALDAETGGCGLIVPGNRRVHRPYCYFHSP